MAITVNGQSTTSFLVGSNLTLLCSAQSSPPAQLQWVFKGQTLNTTGPVLSLYNVSENQSGPYACVAFNNVTTVNTSITAKITISELRSGFSSVHLFIFSELHPIFVLSLQTPQDVKSHYPMCGSFLSCPGLGYSCHCQACPIITALSIFFINTVAVECNMKTCNIM